MSALASEDEAANGDRVVLTTCGDGSCSVYLTDGGSAGLAGVPIGAPPPEGVSHLLMASDALLPGRWGSHITLCGLEMRPGPLDATTAQDDDPHFDFFRYCPECAQEAARWRADAVDPASTVRQCADRIGQIVEF